MKLKRRRRIQSSPLCECGCGQPVKKRLNGSYNRFIVGHNPKRYGKTEPANTGKKNHPDSRSHNGQFRPGHSGNPKGSPQGSRNKVTVVAQNIFEAESQAISKKAVQMALDGDRAMIKLILERLVPVKKSAPIKLPDLPKVNSVSDASTLTGYILKSVADGRLSPVDGEIISRGAERHLRALQVGDLEQRLSELESKLCANH